MTGVSRRFSQLTFFNMSECQNSPSEKGLFAFKAGSGSKYPILGRFTFNEKTAINRIITHYVLNSPYSIPFSYLSSTYL